MASLSFHHPRLRFFHNLPKPHLECPTPTNYPKIICGLRAGPRKALWRSRVLSTEAIQAIQSLKLMKESGVSPDRLTFKILIRNLQGCGEDELAAVSLEKFIEEVRKKTDGGGDHPVLVYGLRNGQLKT